jgi:murein L,D-transpeptidase YcbB/YkuD
MRACDIAATRLQCAQGLARTQAWFVLFLLALLPTLDAAAGAEPPPREAYREALRERVEALRGDGRSPVGAGHREARAFVAGLYETRSFEPLWTDAMRVDSLRRAIDTSAAHGLDPRDYHAQALAVPPPSADARALAEHELLLTDAMMRLAYHLHFGKVDARALQPSWNIARTLAGVDPAAAFVRLLAAPDPASALESLAPSLPGYAALRRVLAELRAAQERGGWTQVPPGPTLQTGAGGPRVAALRERLSAAGDLPAAASAGAAATTGFDEALAAAVRRFQARHGLDSDGRVGAQTLAALNVPLATRIDQVRANLERLRWVARDLTGDHLLVDIAGFEAWLWLDGREAWRSRVIVGRAYRRTPEFRSTMEYLVFNPEWVVPPTILRNDVLPRVLRDRSHLEQQRMRLVDLAGRVVSPAAVDWNAVRERPGDFPYRIVQAPGPNNALGRIRFMAPNEHVVFLHDTPSRELFDRTVRAFSSGCIRVERPLELAELLLADAERWSASAIAAALDAGRTQTLPVRQRVPLLLLYHTARAGDGDRPEFRADLYGRDAPIVRALAAPFRYVSAVRATRPRP